MKTVSDISAVISPFVYVDFGIRHSSGMSKTADGRHFCEISTENL